MPLLSEPRFTLVGDPCGVLLFAFGSAFAAAVRRVDDRRGRILARRDYVAVDRLWRQLAPMLARTSGPRGSDIDVSRKVVEIFDARLAWSPYLPAELRRQFDLVVGEQGIVGDRAQLLAEAAELRLAIDDLTDGSRCGVAPSTNTLGDPAAEVDARREESTVFVDDKHEISRLATLAALVDHPLVADIAATARQRCTG
jgi:hypothetical protein